MDNQLTIESQVDAARGICTFKLTGPLLLSNMFEFQSRLREEKSRGMIIDLSGVPYIDSAGIGVLVNGMVSCKNHDRTLVLSGVVERVMTVLRVTKVDTLFHFADSKADAEALAANAS
jgi:anti-sigma B factor antagonist